MYNKFLTLLLLTKYSRSYILLTTKFSLRKVSYIPLGLDMGRKRCSSGTSHNWKPTHRTDWSHDCHMTGRNNLFSMPSRNNNQLAYPELFQQVCTTFKLTPLLQ